MFENNWFVPLKTHPDNILRLFCFHYAGGNVSAYRPWIEQIEDGIDLIAIQLPGRENRFGDSLITDMDLVVENLYHHFSHFQDKPYLFFGHSLGALIAFEFATKLQQQSHQNLKHLLVSGSRAPHLPIRRKPIYSLPDQAIFTEIQKYNGIPSELLNEKELLMEIMVPIIRADFTISDLYRSSPEIKLHIPITAFGGREDDTFPFEDLLRWERHTEVFNHHCFSGDHFFIKSSFTEVMETINTILEKEKNGEQYLIN